MKKLLCILLAVMLTMSLCACSGDDDVRGEVATDPKLSLGTTANNTYKNDFLGIRCTLPSDWVFYTDEEIMELNNFVGEAAGDSFQNALENAEIIHDMYASYQGGKATLNVTIQKLSALQLAGLDMKTSLESQFPTIKTSLENIGYTNVQMQYEKVTVDGKEFDGMTVTASFSGIPFYETAFCFVKGRYLANVTIASLQTNNIPGILECFTFL